jgi:Protein of unknown function (DUF1653)
MITKTDTSVSHVPSIDFRPGIYKHSKSGNLYSAIGLVFHHDEQRPMVLYVSLVYGTPAVRPLYGWADDPDAWLDEVVVESASGARSARRFEFQSSVPTNVAFTMSVR